MTMSDREQRQIREILELLREVEAWMDGELPHVQERSALWADDQRSHPYDVSQGVSHAISVAVDHLHAMRMALTGVRPDRIDLHTYAPFTLLRAALENTCTALWITGAATRTERIARRLRLETKSLKHNEQLLRSVGVDCTADLAARRARLRQVADGCGITHAAIGAGPSPTEITKAVGHRLGRTADEQMSAWQLWSVCSAFAHGDWWVLPLLDIEILGPASPGVSKVRPTAPTEMVLESTRAVLRLVRNSRAEFIMLSHHHLGP
ncbi:hypothetical protein [Dactylosporangium sp. CA-139066]|uniref:hypothetical protein n=1 Tax=Dactylosporangium sp. CA-139066 TaxID=3239930 RepID=UPI003D8E704C